MVGAAIVFSAFSEDHVERLTGLSAGQLRYWDRTGFFAPTYADEDRRTPYSRIYSFRDVVALRTLGLLRNDYKVSLQHLRDVAQSLNHLRETLWTKTTLYVVKKRVHVVTKKGERPIDPVTGQYALDAIELRAVMADVTHESATLRARPSADIGRITRHKFIARNAAVVAGTRIPARAIKNFHESGYTVDAIIAEYPDLTRADVAAALAHREGSASAAH
jgi:uncharacterized protein (DUF433 family)